MLIKLSPAVREDLGDIWDYSERQWGTDRADEYLDALRDRMLWLTINQNLWKKRDDLGKDMCSYAQQSHIIYFRQPNGNGAAIIEIIRILHQSMDAERHV